mmetsp:Transcript_14228/g.44255  ORF Transcript_14228/g.44255 Transcript_14228/m.44255 type:complete len:166 (+) Transcript_14228:76-573(+)
MGALARLAAAAAALALLADARMKGIFSAYTDTLDERECTCACCIREPRRPNEVVGDSRYKCAMPPSNDRRWQRNGCTSTCTVVNDPIFPSSVTVETNRYCFYHCEPTVGGSQTALHAAIASQQQAALLNGGSLVDAECVSIRPAMLEQAASADHNGRDIQAALSA